MSGNGHNHECDVEMITLLDEEGNEHDFELINIIQVDENEYAVLLPPEDDATEAFVLRRTEDEEGNELLVDIEDEDEWQRVVAAWRDFLESAEFEEE